MKEEYNLVIFDEVNIALRDKFILLKDFLSFLKEKPLHQEWILTGRGAPDKVLKEASLVTEMREVKHSFRTGVKARKGIEY